jgi:hypothetical protein
LIGMMSTIGSAGSTSRSAARRSLTVVAVGRVDRTSRLFRYASSASENGMNVMLGIGERRSL